MAKRSRKQRALTSEVSRKAAAKGALAAELPGWFGQDWLRGCLLVMAVILVYQPVWYAGFIWDDDHHVTAAALRSWAGLARIWFELGGTQQYYPLVHSFFWIEHCLWGDWPLGYHLVNVFLQALAALLLVKILQRLEVPGAWLAAAIFALHPVQVETVAWVTELKNTLSGILYLGSALVYLEFDRTRKPQAYTSSLLLFGLGLISKSVIATLPAALLVVFWWKRGKLSWKQDVLPLVPFFVVGIFSGLFTAWVERHFIGADGSEYNYTFIERTLIAGHALWFYLGKLLWPTNLIFIYPRWEISQAIWWQYLFPATALLVAALLIWLSRRWRGPLAGFLFFAGTLFPALGYLNVYPFRFSFVADHFQYLACLGVIVPLAAGLTLLADAYLPRKIWLRMGLCAGLLLVLGALSWQRSWAYESAEKLWIDTLAQNPNCWLGHTNLGAALYQKGLTDEAIAECQKAIALNPNFVEAHGTLGSAFLQKGELDQAIVEYQKALKIKPDLAEAHYDLANALFQKGKVDEAMAENREALKIKPAYAQAYYSIGTILLREGQVDEAIANFQKAVEIDPDYAEAHNNLGIAFSRKGDLNQTIAQFKEVVRLKPQDLQAQRNLAKAQQMHSDGADQK